jgi:hypothetical protein
LGEEEVLDATANEGGAERRIDLPLPSMGIDKFHAAAADRKQAAIYAAASTIASGTKGATSRS